MKIHNFDLSVSVKARKNQEKFTLYTQYWRGKQVTWLYDNTVDEYGMAYLYIGYRPSMSERTSALLNWEVAF